MSQRSRRGSLLALFYGSIVSLSPIAAQDVVFEGPIVDEVGALADDERREIRTAIDTLLQRCDLAVGVALVPGDDESVAAARAGTLRRQLRAAGVLPRASMVFVFAGPHLAAWDSSRSGQRVLPAEVVRSAWQETADISPFATRFSRFLDALASGCGRRGTPRAPPTAEDDDDGEEDLPEEALEPAQQTDRPTDGFEVYLEVDWNLPDGASGDFLSFGSESREFPDHPRLTWFGGAFECAAFATEPGPEVWDSDQKRIATTRRERRCRLFGAVSSDGTTLVRLTIVWRSLHLRDDELVLEYQEWSAALTNVPSPGGPTHPGLSFEIAGSGRETIDHVLEFRRQRGFPSYPETEYAVSHASLARLAFRFSVF